MDLLTGFNNVFEIENFFLRQIKVKTDGFLSADLLKGLLLIAK